MSPDDQQDPDKDRRVDYVCTVGKQLYAFEHIGIEPFEQQIKMEVEDQNCLRRSWRISRTAFRLANIGRFTGPLRHLSASVARKSRGCKQTLGRNPHGYCRRCRIAGDRINFSERRTTWEFWRGPLWNSAKFTHPESKYDDLACLPRTRSRQGGYDGRLSHGMGVTRLADLPAEWSQQYQILGLPPR